MFATGKAKAVLAGIFLAALMLAGCHVSQKPDPVLAALKSEAGESDLFRPRPYLELAMALQSIPEQERAVRLRQWAADRDNDWEIIFLCCMLFDPRPGATLRAPNLGKGVLNVGGAAPANWPAWPLAMQNDVPFSLVETDTQDGTALPPPYTGESGASYLEYCLANGQWTSRHYGAPDSAKLDQALTDLLRSPRWGANSPNDIVERKLAEQLSCDCGAGRRQIPYAP